MKGSSRVASLLRLSSLHLLSTAPLANLIAISLEKMYSVFNPLKHHAMKMTVYYVTICVVWAEALIREILQFALSEALNNNVAVLIDSSLYLPY